MLDEYNYYLIKVIDEVENNDGNLYLSYTHTKGFHLVKPIIAQYFKIEDLLNNKELKHYLNNKVFELEEYTPKQNDLKYRYKKH